MPEQNPNPVMPAQPAPMPMTPAPMPEPTFAPVQTQPQPASMPPTQSGGSKRLLWIAIIFVVLALAGFGVWYYMALNQSNSVATTYKVMPTAVATPTPTPTTDTIAPIQNASDLNGVLNQVNGSTSSSMQTDLNQNTSDSSSFSQ